jgi:hypothetical protein
MFVKCIGLFGAISFACVASRAVEISQPHLRWATTDSANYTLAGPFSRTTVRVSFTNASTDTVFLSRCGKAVGTLLQQLRASGWRTVSPDICSTVLGEPLTLVPGRTEQIVVHVAPGPGVDHSDLVGTLRVLIAAYSSATSARFATSEKLLPLESRATAGFTVLR